MKRELLTKFNRRDIKPICFHGSVNELKPLFGKTAVGLKRKVVLNGRKSKGLSKDIGWDNPMA